MRLNSGSSRRGFLQTTMIASATVALRPALNSASEISRAAESSAAEVKPFELEEITISELQDGMKSASSRRGRWSRNTPRALKTSTSAR